MNQYYDAPNLPSATYPMKLFYLFQLGKHASRLFSHIFIRPEGNYYEYVLHHSLSTFLIFFSYLTNQWLIGIMVLLCHDASDFFLILSRGYKVKKYFYLGLQKLFKKNTSTYLRFCLDILGIWKISYLSILLCLCISICSKSSWELIDIYLKINFNVTLSLDGIHVIILINVTRFLDLLYRQGIRRSEYFLKNCN